MTPKLSIIIIHYKTLELTRTCIRGLINTLPDKTEIIIVDNDSQDGAKQVLTDEFSSLKWITNSSNEGFGRANNLGAKHAKGEYLLFLNSDVEISENTIHYGLTQLQNDPTIGVFGPKLLNSDGTHQHSTYHYVGHHQELLKRNLLLDKITTFNTPSSILAVMGSFMLMRRDVFVASKGFDPDFFMYCEELDLCHRIHQSGLNIHYGEEVSVIHHHGGSSSSNEWVIRQSLLSRSLLVYKKKGFFGYVLSHFIELFNFITNGLLMWLLDQQYRKNYSIYYRSYFANWLKYWSIPFTFTRNLGNGKRLLKST